MFAYITLLTTNNYYFAILTLKLSLDKVQSQYPLIVLYTDEVDINYIKELESIGCICQKEEIKFDFKDSRWHQTFVKFEMYKMIEYEKLCFLDADILVNDNIDYVFTLQDPYIYEVYRNMECHILTCFMLVTPDIQLYNEIVNFTINFFSMLETDGHNNHTYTEEQILSLFYLNNSKYTFTYLKPTIIAHVNANNKILKSNKSIYHYMSLKKPWEIYTNYFWNYYLKFITDNIDFLEAHYFVP